VIRRLREGSRPAFPPSRRDAVILGGTLFDLLDQRHGPDACRQLVSGPRRNGPELTLGEAFDARPRDVESAWRDYLREIAHPSLD
jgi:hypothetical protein